MRETDRWPERSSGFRSSFAIARRGALGGPSTYLVRMLARSGDVATLAVAWLEGE